MSLVEKDGFAFAGDTLLARASGQHLHRRASHAELRELFQPPISAPRTLKDHPGHWYESQLIHYGLPPSKSKAVAKVRLLDAFNKNTLVVPRSLQTLESDLKKEWDRGIRQSVAATSSQNDEKKEKIRHAPKKNDQVSQDAKSSIVTPTSKRKRKSDNSTNLTRGSPSKVAVTAKPGMARTLKRPHAAEGVLSVVKRIRGTAAPKKLPSQSATQDSPPATPRRLLARRSKPFNPGRRFDSRSCQAAAHREYDSTVTPRQFERSDCTPVQQSAPGAPGVYSGDYEVQTSICNEWSEYDDYKSAITLVAFGNEIWGAYDFGMFEGVFRVTALQQSMGRDAMHFCWRGIENSENVISYADDHQFGEISLTTDGDVQGEVRGLYGNVSFRGQRATQRPSQSLSSLKSTWASYSEEAYEMAQAERWH